MVSSLWPVNKNDRSAFGRLWTVILFWGDKNRNSLPKNFVLPVDKSGRWGYYKCNITKMAVKRRVGLRIDPYQKARAMEKGRKQEAENGLGAVRARHMSAKPATGCARYSVRL